MKGDFESKMDSLKIAEEIKNEYQIHIKKLRAPQIAVPSFWSEHQKLSAVLLLYDVPFSRVAYCDPERLWEES